MLGAVLALAPRGAAWGTDEAGDGSGASPLLRSYWERLGQAFGLLYKFAFDSAIEAFPSAISASLDEWELELGLPDPCSGGGQSIEARIRAVRMKFAALGGSSPAYFICLARLAGYTITIDEPSPFMCGRSRCGGTERLTNVEVRAFWIVRPVGAQTSWFRAGLSRAGLDPLGKTDRFEELECLLRAVAPMHTRLIFSYA